MVTSNTIAVKGMHVALSKM